MKEQPISISIMNLFFIFRVLLIAYWQVSQVTCLVAYDCEGDQVNKTTISLVDIPNCTRNNSKPQTHEVQVIITQTSNQEEFSAYRCSVQASHVLKRCGKWLGDDSIVGYYSQVIRVESEECKRLIEQKTYRVPFASSTVFQFPDTGSYEESFVSYGGYSEDGSCYPGGDLSYGGKHWDRVVRYTSLKIAFSMTKAIIDFEEKVIIFPNGIRCDLLKQYCEQADYGWLYWSIPTPKCNNDEGNQAILYRGLAQLIMVDSDNGNDTFIQLSHSGYDFQIKLEKKQTNICGFKSHFTEHPRLFVTMTTEISPPFPDLKAVDPKSVSMINYINSKIVYSLRHTRSQVEKLFWLFEKDRCLSQNRITSNMMAIANISPIQFVFAYFHEPGYTAVVRGEVAYVAKCAPVLVELVQDRLPNCYNELVVSHNNITRFMSPRSRILVKIGSIIDCSNDFGPMYKLHNQWVMQTQIGVVPARTPITIAPEELIYSFEPLESIANGGLYRSDIILQYQKILTSPLEETIISSRIINTLQTGSDLPEGVNIMNSFNKKSVSDFKSKMDSISDNAKGMGTWWATFLLGSFCVKLFCSVVNALINFYFMKKNTHWIICLISCIFDSISHLIISGFLVYPRRKPGDNNEQLRLRVRQDHIESGRLDLE